jgi:hypothetical protein|tara:strand:- start:4883 stop:5506 length:624 start_codon:yes stop_codon:yes gene_type:complete
MMKNKVSKLIGIAVAGLLMANCSATYNMKSEKGKVLNEVPKWYMADFKESKACDTPKFGKDKDKMCIFGVGTAVSPDLNLAIEKGMMIAKAELADIIKGEMNKSSKQFITELGKNNNKTTVSEVESTIVNLIKETPVRGYEIFAKDVTITKNGYYRAWIGLRLPMGEYNKMYNFTIEEAVDSYNVKKKANIAYDNLMKTENENSNIQ